MFHEFDGLDPTEKAGIEAALNNRQNQDTTEPLPPIRNRRKAFPQKARE
jgi:hypothetical protein